MKSNHDYSNVKVQGDKAGSIRADFTRRRGKSANRPWFVLIPTSQAADRSKTQAVIRACKDKRLERKGAFMLNLFFTFSRPQDRAITIPHFCPQTEGLDNDSVLSNVTELLVAWSDGDKSAEKELFSLVYRELRRLAHRYMFGENPGNTLQTTALVNEAYLRLIDRKHADWQNRAHFFGFSAQVMRHILVDLARSKNYQKRGGEVRKVPWMKAW